MRLANRSRKAFALFTYAETLISLYAIIISGAPSSDNCSPDYSPTLEIGYEMDD